MDKIKVLVVDDDEMMRGLCKAMLERYYADVQTATAKGVAEALTLLSEEEEFDIVITDMEMPDGSGRQVVEKAKSIFPSWVIVMSGRLSEEEMMATGANTFLSKPFTYQEFATVLV